ncbi:protein kinase domain-containing protein [Cystobacter fuscus]|uniref:protein kinase domain-containing protein n=1 Tax=Cystobacter fuscus TaxID=43 RepID=UPI0012FDD66E|nr:protein kinase [Cystobacter fuscus]
MKRSLGPYHLVRKIATGGMAEVYLARKEGPGGISMEVALKRILPHLAEEKDFQELFLSEVRLATRLRHPNVVQVFDFGEHEGTWFLATEYVDGPTLKTLIRKGAEFQRPLPPPLAARIIAWACKGLVYAHELRNPDTGQPLGIVHRDISSDNIMLTRGGWVKVVDFGIAKTVDQLHQTHTGIFRGKLAYMPPERLRGEAADVQMDVFALGIVLYELLTGRKPFNTEIEEAIGAAILTEPFVPVQELRSGLPEPLQRIVHRAIAKEPQERYPNCRTFMIELKAWLATLAESSDSQALEHYLAELGFTAPESAELQPAQETPVKRSPPPAPPTPATPRSTRVSSKPRHPSRRWAVVGVVAAALLALAAVLRPSGLGSADPSPDNPALPPVTPVEISILYGTEKHAWLRAATQAFHERHPLIRVTLEEAGSLESLEALLSGERRPTIWSPASQDMLRLLEHKWRERTGAAEAPLIEKHESVVMTPLVIVKWRSNQRWSSKDAFSWDALRGHLPERGDNPLSIGMTNPACSNSGLQALQMMHDDYHRRHPSHGQAAADQDFRLWLKPLKQFLRVSRNSSGDFMEEMLRFGSTRYEMAVVYESLALSKLQVARDRWEEFELLYPSLTYWSDHPMAIMTRWTQKSQREAAQEFIRFLLSPPIQKLALEHGFRPVDTGLSLTEGSSPFTLLASSGVKRVLPPEAPRLDAALSLGLLTAWGNTQCVEQ